MGKYSKSQEAEMKRQYQEARRREEEEKQRKQNRLMWHIILCIVAVVITVAVIAVTASLWKNTDNEQDSETETETEPASGSTVSMDDLDLSAISLDQCSESNEVTEYVCLNISYTDKNGLPRTGDVVIRLFEEIAPITVSNFQDLVGRGFYNGLTFHRVSPGFMIQGGDPEGDGSGDSGKNIKGEFLANGFQNNLSHVRGVVSMARGTPNNSASCQFFIVHEDSQASLDGKYASFGFVVYGMDTVDAITQIDLDYKADGIDLVATSPRYPVIINDASFVTVTE